MMREHTVKADFTIGNGANGVPLIQKISAVIDNFGQEDIRLLVTLFMIYISECLLAMIIVITFSSLERSRNGIR